MSATQPVRRRDAGATKEAILASARLAFIRSGYDGAGVREIAEGAGVTAMLTPVPVRVTGLPVTVAPV